MDGSTHSIRPQGKARAPAAFTLIELLVVVAILSLLLAILIPSLSAARAQSKRVVCLANLKQIHAGWEMFLQASGDRFLQGVNVNWNYGGMQGTGGVAFGSDRGNPVPKPLNEFLGFPLVVTDDAPPFRCPADSGGPIAPEKERVFDYYGTSYPTNYMLVGPSYVSFPPIEVEPCAEILERVNPRLPKLRRDRVANEGRLILMGDAGWTDVDIHDPRQRFYWHSKPQWYNLAFLDGHAEYLHVRPGIYDRAGDYTFVPFGDVAQDLVDSSCQREIP